MNGWMNEWMDTLCMDQNRNQNLLHIYIHTYIHTQIVTYITHTGAPKIENWKSRKKIPIHSISIGLSPININQSINQKCQRFEFSILSFSICSFSIFNFFSFQTLLTLLYPALPPLLSSHSGPNKASSLARDIALTDISASLELQT